MQRTQQLRTATQTRRSARAGAYPEPDDFEGLPVRQWRQEWVTVAPSAQQETTQQGDRWAADLPYGMPREFNLLPPHTQELLRAARSGRLYKRSAPTEEEDADVELDTVKGEKKDWEPPNDGYTVKLWKQVPRNAESQTTSHLAKRHKNTVTLASRAAVPQIAGPTVTRATVRRIDAAGNPYEQTVTLADGQHVEGEIISTTVVPAPAAAQQEAAPQQVTPSRRRPPPPKRKNKGVGRGRKKGKLPIPLPATRSQATNEDGTPVQAESVGPNVIKREDTEESTNHDSEMVDISGVASDEEEGEPGEGDEEEEGDEDHGPEEESETTTTKIESSGAEEQAQEAEDSEMMDVIQPSSVEEPDESQTTVGEVEEVTIPKARFTPPSLSNLGVPHPGSAGVGGSPLKNVMTQSPTDPSPTISPSTNTFASAARADIQQQTSSTTQAHASKPTGHGILPSLRESAVPRPSEFSPPAPAFLATGTPSKPASVSPPVDQSGHASKEPTSTSLPVPKVKSASPPVKTEHSPALPPTTLDASTVPEAATALSTASPTPAAATADEDDGLNLLGSLERELDRQEGVHGSGDGSGSGSGNGRSVSADGPGNDKKEEGFSNIKGEDTTTTPTTSTAVDAPATVTGDASAVTSEDATVGFGGASEGAGDGEVKSSSKNASPDPSGAVPVKDVSLEATADTAPDNA
ncbi:hypothetical protein B0J18DRAFT_488019 [Chaetomium sp. MPI-SDFR-AT-0129]|nr:hypothetical protein B0J18DRAFT_488019 [Chaetomium sp. MPI-SDFR-AT-0129]